MPGERGEKSEKEYKIFFNWIYDIILWHILQNLLPYGKNQARHDFVAHTLIYHDNKVGFGCDN